MKGSTKRRRKINIRVMRRTCSIILGAVDINGVERVELCRYYSRLSRDHFVAIMGVKEFTRRIKFPKLPADMLADPRTKFFVRIYGRIMKDYSFNAATFDLTDTKKITNTGGGVINPLHINWPVVNPFINKAIEIMVRDVYDKR